MLFIIFVSLTVTLFSEKFLIPTRCKRGFMPNLIKTSVTVSNLGFAAEYNVFGRKNGHLSNEFPIVDSIPDIRLATIVVGRKFSLHHLERALFLRLPKNLRKHTVSCLVTAKKFDLSKFECGGGEVLKSSIESEVEIDNDGEKCSSVIENDVPSNAPKVSVQRVVELGRHFATLCQEVDFNEANFFLHY